MQKTQEKRCLHYRNTDGTHGQWKTEVEWNPKDWTKTRGNARCKECCHQGLGNDEKKERPHGGGQRSKDKGRESLHQTVLICQPTDTGLRGDDRDLLGTVTLTVEDFRRIGTQHGTWVSQSGKTRTSWNQPGMRQRAGVLTSSSLRRSYVTADRYCRKRIRRRIQMSTSGP